MATKPTKPTTKADDAFEVVDPSEDTGSAPVKEQSFTPAVYSDDFDDGLDPARLKVPSMNLVHGVGEYKTHYTVGTFVIGNLDRAVEILKGNLEKFKDPARAKTEGRFTCAVVAVSRPVFQPDVKQEDPNFKVELADKAAVAEAGGTTDRKVSYATGQQFYVPKSECLLLIRKPEWVDADNDDFFPHELDGGKWALVKYFAKKSAFSNFVEPLRSQRLVHPKLKDTKDPTTGVVTRGRPYGALMLMGVKTIQTPKASFYAPDVIPSPEPIGPEAFEFCSKVDPVVRQ
jgi:hypothetical protein